jgi:hypothetical protein
LVRILVASLVLPGDDVPIGIAVSGFARNNVKVEFSPWMRGPGRTGRRNVTVTNHQGLVSVEIVGPATHSAVSNCGPSEGGSPQTVEHTNVELGTKEDVQLIGYSFHGTDYARSTYYYFEKSLGPAPALASSTGRFRRPPQPLRR